MTHFQNQLGQNHLMTDATMLKQDAQLLRSNEILGGQQLGGQQLLHNNLGNQGATIIEKDITIVEQNCTGHNNQFQGSPRLMQGSPRLMQGSPRLVQGSPRLVQLQGSPTGLIQGSPMRQGGFNQSLGAYTGQSLGGTTTTTTTCTQGTGLVQGQSLGHLNQGQFTNQQFSNQQFTGQQFAGQQQFAGKQFFNQEQLLGQNYSQGETIVERIVEAPIVVTHHEQAVVKSLYEGRELLRTDEVAITQSHSRAPIVKEIHQDVIHEHHKDVLIEHKKDIVHEHHQNIIHQHSQPVIYEKHIHEHHQPIIHEKHTTLIEEKHIPIVTEQHSLSTNYQEKQEIVHEVFDQPIVKEVFVNPVVKEVVGETIVHREGHEFLNQSQQHLHSSGNQHFVSSGQTGIVNSGFANQGLVNTGNEFHKTVIEETYTTGGNSTGLIQGTGYTQGTGFNQGTYLGEQQVYANEVDEFGRPKKAGFFSNLKNKMGGHKNREPKII